MLTVLFFFSSRRRHTRWNCDWSSDVCSSDLVVVAGLAVDFAVSAAIQPVLAMRQRLTHILAYRSDPGGRSEGKRRAGRLSIDRGSFGSAIRLLFGFRRDL